MWNFLASLIIRYRLYFVLGTVVITAFFGWHARKLDWSYDYVSIVPKDDPDMIFFEKFRKTYGEDGNIMAIGFADEKLFNIKNFAQYQKLCADLAKIEGVNEIISIPTLKKLSKDTFNQKFVLQPIFEQPVQTQAELDSILKIAFSVKFYDGLIFNQDSKATIIAVNLNKDYLNSLRRKALVGKITELCTDFSNNSGIEQHLAGLPYVRYIMISAFKQEFNLLLALSSLVTCVILFLFFRTFSSVLFTVLVIVVTVIWTGGIIVLFGYKINLLTGMLPALIVVISIPTCIYMFNKYHQELKRHGNKIKAVTRIVEKIGFVTFMTNANTAVGFLVLVFTDISVIKEFGWIAGIMSLATFVISIIVIPALFLYLPDPSEKQMMHLDKKSLNWLNNQVVKLVLNHRIAIYITTIFFVTVSVYGITKIQPIGFMVDDMPDRSTIKSDLKWFEDNFGGVMPLEILVDLGKKKAAYSIKNLEKLDLFQAYLLTEKSFSPSISILSFIKSATQTYYNDTPENYRLPTNSEKGFILKYFGKQNSQLTIIRSFVDSSAQVVRFSLKVADLGTKKMDELLNGRLKSNIQEIFSSDPDIKVSITGTSLLFLKGNKFLLEDLTQSMFIAFALISLMMAFLFFDLKMILISVIPNIIPMIITAGIMGLFDIRMKISTAVIFSISFGITIDSTIHYLSKFKQEIANVEISVLDAVLKSIKEAGVSMIYTGFVLICGFGIFTFSEFGGTIALGVLTCLTLFFALLTNMILLPALIVTFVKKKE